MRDLRSLRLRRGLSQADLSTKSGVSEFTISEIEAGKRPNARPSTARKLAAGLGVNVADLYGEALEAPKAPTPQPDPEEAVEVIHIKGEVSERTRRKPWSLTVTHTWDLEDVLEDVEAGRTEEAATKLRELIGSTA